MGIISRDSSTRRGIPPPSPTSTSHPAATTSRARTDEELIKRRQRFALTKSKLSRITEVVSFMAGFTVVAIAEIQVPDPPNQWLLTAFVITTSLLASSCGFVIMVAAWVLPQLQANEELDFVLIETKMVKQFASHRLFKLEKQFRYIVQGTWILASIGSVFLFTLDVIIVFWLKFSHSKGATIGSTIILLPLLLILLWFGIFFRKKLLKGELFEALPDDDEDGRSDFVSYRLENERYLEIVSDRRISNAC